MSWVWFVAWLGLGVYAVPKMDDLPEGDWSLVGTYAHVLVVNETTDSVPVSALAPDIDHAVRFLGWVPAQDLAAFRLPYADTEVTILLGGEWVSLQVDKPEVHWVVKR